MNTIKIGTLNVQNNKINRTGGITIDGIDNVQLLVQHINNNGYYFIGVQELTRIFSERFIDNSATYKLYGNYRYGSSNLVKNIKVLDSFNESNAIVTSKQVVNSKTSLLPWFPFKPHDLIDALKHGSIMPRIISLAEINDDNLGTLYALNTHLDYQVKSVQIKQLKRIFNLIKHLTDSRYPIVLTGDFNMEIGTTHFDEFIENLQSLGLKRVPVNAKTNATKYPNQTAIDHVFVPNTWIIENAGLIEDDLLNNITDHKGVFADVKVK